MEKYSSDVQKMISTCETVAFRFGHSLVGSEHLLLAFLKSDTVLNKELAVYKVTFDAVYKKVKDLYPRHESDPLYMEYTIELKNLLDNAALISKQYHEEVISLNALSVALLISESTMAYELLKKMKVDIRQINQSIQNKMARKSELASVSDLHNLSEVAKDPLIGRENELRQLINALSRRNKPNAILVGEPGVGKTAIVEELARMLKDGEIPSLKNKMIYELDLASTVGGTKYRGEFEEKIKKIIKKVMEDGNCILFIDEIHNVIRAGGAEGAIDASNILKPYLSRNEIQIIGATTEDEFQSVFEKDKALKRRFQVIKVEPSTESETREILHRIKGIYEKHYRLKIDDDILDYIVSLTSRSLPNFFFPDKAIDVLDNSCVVSKGTLEKETVDKTVESYYKICVNSDNKKEIVFNKIKEKIYGQNRALSKISDALALVDHQIYDRDKPMLNLLFLGPSGVGKTEIAKIIGETYFGKDNIIYLDMSSYQEINALSKLIGVGIGYNGQEINPKLVRELKAHPKSLILLDEIEKASNEVLDFFLQIMDQGFFDSAKGEKIDCRSAMIVMTSNYGFDSSLSFRMNLDSFSYADDYIFKQLQNRFRFEFLSRIDDIIVFDFLNETTRREIARGFLKEYRIDTEMADLEEILVHSPEEYAKFGARLIRRDCKKAILNRLIQKQN